MHRALPGGGRAALSAARSRRQGKHGSKEDGLAFHEEFRQRIGRIVGKSCAEAEAEAAIFSGQSRFAVADSRLTKLENEFEEVRV